MYRLEIGEAPETGLRRIVLEKIAETIALLTASSGPEAVHDVRKAIKRIRATLRLARPALEPGAYRSENYRFRDLGRLLAGLRDSVVVGETFERILRIDDRTEEEIEDFRRLLLDPGTGLLRFASDPDPRLIDRLIAGLRAAAENPDFLLLGSPGIDFVKAGLADTARKARAGLKCARKCAHSPEAFHEWRKQVKYLWHQFELLAAIAEPPNTVPAEDLEHLSEQLGLAHDAAVLEDRLIPLGAEAKVEPIAGLVRRVYRDRRDHEAAALLHGKSIFRQKNRDLLAWYPPRLSGDRVPTG